MARMPRKGKGLGHNWDKRYLNLSHARELGQLRCVDCGCRAVVKDVNATVSAPGMLARLDLSDAGPPRTERLGLGNASLSRTRARSAQASRLTPKRSSVRPPV